MRSVWTVVRWASLSIFLFAVPASGAPDFLPSNRLTNSPPVRAAFRDVAAPARAWTVQVRRGDRGIALGVVVSSDGLILTKLSEVQPMAATSPSPTTQASRGSGDEAALNCRFSGGKAWPATLVAEHPATDLALLRVAAADLRPVVWATDSKLELGRWLVSAVPEGDAISIGVVSSRRHAVRAQRIPGFLGVELERKDGPATVERVVENSAAADAGLEPGDIVERLGDEDVRTGRSLTWMVRRHQPGDVVQLQVRRGMEVMTMDVTLSHPLGEAQSQYAMQTRMGGPLSRKRDGYDDVFSQDGSVTPQDCGGPVVDLTGAAVGMNIARAGRTETLILPAEVILHALDEMRSSLKSPAG